MGGELGLSRAFLRSCSEQNLSVGDTVYKNIKFEVEGDEKTKQNKQKRICTEDLDDYFNFFILLFFSCSFLQSDAGVETNI